MKNKEKKEKINQSDKGRERRRKCIIFLKKKAKQH